jgi:hypothetical protein
LTHHDALLQQRGIEMGIRRRFARRRCPQGLTRPHRPARRPRARGGRSRHA